MRNDYGKMVYMLQDTSPDFVQELLQFSCVAPVETVYDYLVAAEVRHL